MKKLVLLLMLFGALRSFGAVATNVQNLSQFGSTNRMIAGDGIGISVRYATAQERLLGIRASNLVYSLNLLGIGTNTVFISAGTNIIVVTNRTSSNVTYTISVATNDLGGASSMTNALLHAGPTNGSVGALILTAGNNIILSTSGTNRVITTSNNVSLVDVTNIVNNATNGLGVSPPLSSVQYNSNGVQSGSSLFVFTNSMVGIGTNAPAYPLHLFVGDPSLTGVEISYTNGAGNTVAFQVRSGTGVTNFQVEVGGLVRSVTIANSGTITGATATVTALNVTGGTLGAGKVLTDTGGTGAATWETPAAVSGALTPGVTNVASASTIIIDLAATNTPCISVTNVAAHNISLVVSNPYPGRWFSFYVDGSGTTNNTLAWSSVAGLQLKWLDAVTNILVLSNGYVNVSGWVATMNRNTNMVITYRDE